MIIKRERFSSKQEACDFCGEHHTLDHAIVARGATGRWCEVMWVCQGCAEKNNYSGVLTAEQGRQWIEDHAAADGSGDYADF